MKRKPKLSDAELVAAFDRAWNETPIPERARLLRSGVGLLVMSERPWARLRCEKCNTLILVPDNTVAGGRHPYHASEPEPPIAVIRRQDWSARHDGSPLECPFHPGMRYYLRHESEAAR